MTLVARHARTTTDPGTAPIGGPGIARTVILGQHDTFLPTRTLAPAARCVLRAEPIILTGTGHFAIDERPDDIAELSRPAR